MKLLIVASILFSSFVYADEPDHVEVRKVYVQQMKVKSIEVVEDCKYPSTREGNVVIQDARCAR